MRAEPGLGLLVVLFEIRWWGRLANLRYGRPCGLLYPTINSPPISAKFVSVSRECPKLSRKCPTFFGHFVHVLFVFIHIPALNVLYLYFCFPVFPAGPSRRHYKAPHPPQAGVLQSFSMTLEACIEASISSPCTFL